MENRVTGEMVKQAMIEKNITAVDHHDCGGCGVMVRYYREGEQLYFDPSCGCSSLGGPEPRDWDNAANWINMQSREENAEEIALRFGIDLKSLKENCERCTGEYCDEHITDPCDCDVVDRHSSGVPCGG